MRLLWGKLIWRAIWPGSAILVVGAMGLSFVLLAANAVDTQVTAEDRAVIADLEVDHVCDSTERYFVQLACISAIQNTVFERYPSTKDAFEKGVTGHRVSDYDQRGYGSCYDRAMLIEQALRHYGFEVRRVALFQSQPTPFHYLKPGIRSHALSEVKTARGWMAVESIDPLVAVDQHHTPKSVDEIRDGLQDGTIDDHTFAEPIPDNFFDGDFLYVYGLYSRHGYFFEPHLPVPEVDWAKFGF